MHIISTFTLSVLYKRPPPHTHTHKLSPSLVVHIWHHAGSVLFWTELECEENTPWSSASESVSWTWKKAVQKWGISFIMTNVFNSLPFYWSDRPVVRCECVYLRSKVLKTHISFSFWWWRPRSGCIGFWEHTAEGETGRLWLSESGLTEAFKSYNKQTNKQKIMSVRHPS